MKVYKRLFVKSDMKKYPFFRFNNGWMFAVHIAHALARE